jgi:F-type H+-transporting ATPase subunit gamma
MPSIKDLKKRITSVKNTQQTTRAMKMVSAAKLRRAQDAISSQRPYARQIERLIRMASALKASTEASPLLGGTQGEGATKKRLHLVLVTSDRGLCGGFNASIIKTAQRWMAQNKENYSEIKMSFAGRRGHDFFKNRGVTAVQFIEIGNKVTFPRAKQFSDQLVEGFLNGDCDEVRIIYNEFKNAITQIVQVEQYLPLSTEALFKETSVEDKNLQAYIVKPNPAAMLDALLAKHFSVQMFRILLESQASEHGARMSAMENATKNAGDMIRKLTLQYNKQRQAGITKELLEIIAGSETQKS